MIFLDIDGVVAPIPDLHHYGHLDPTCVQVLNAIVAHTGADVVISSSHRFGRTVAELQQLLDASGFIGRVIDTTPTELRGATRGEEIAAWLTAHPTDGWVILDDHRDMGELADRLVQTQPTRGLQPRDADRAIATLTRA